MSRKPLPTWNFALVVVRLGRRFLVVQERKHDQLWYLPAGWVEPGESFAEAALRETREETGVPIVLEGILRIEHTPGPEAARCRVIFVARPADDSPPKRDPDRHSLQAAWVTLEDLDRMALRGPEVRQLFTHVAAGGTVYPLSLLSPEGLPFA